jgi:hypothetical protein
VERQLEVVEQAIANARAAGDAAEVRRLISREERLNRKEERLDKRRNSLIERPPGALPASA